MIEVLPPEEVNGLTIKAESSLGVLPLVAEHEHDPGVELGEGGGDVALPSLIEYCADQPEVEWVRCQWENVPATQE